MPFASNDYIRIMRSLYISRSNQDLLEDKLGEINDENLIFEIQEVLAEIEAVQEALKTQRQDSNSTLIKADVLEWEPGGRIRGLEINREELRTILADLIGWDIMAIASSLTGSKEIEFF